MMLLFEPKASGYIDPRSAKGDPCGRDRTVAPADRLDSRPEGSSLSSTSCARLSATWVSPVAEASPSGCCKGRST